MAEQVDGAAGELVQECFWIPEAWVEVGIVLRMLSGCGRMYDVSCLLTAFMRCRADDLIPEESEIVQLAIKRLSPKEAYDRVYRMRRAFQV